MLRSTHLSLLVADDPAEMALQAALLMEEQCKEAVAKRNVFTLAISGGQTPLALFRLLSSSEWVNRINWEKTTVYWVDEHCVGPEHSESNYGTARKELLSRVPVTHYYRIKGEADPVQAAEAYEKLLQEHFSLQPGEAPRFDCILLGVGDDGSIGSIAPGSGAEQVRNKLVTDQYMVQLKSSRITMTIPVMNNARCCIFMASGARKYHILTNSLNLMEEPTLPAQMIRPDKGKLCWIIDAAAYKG